MIRKRKSARGIAGIVLFVFVLSMTGCGGSDVGMTMQNLLTVSVETEEVGYTSIEEYAKISCQVEADNEVIVTPKVGGTVKAVYVTAGDVVRAGDVLFEIDRASLERSVVQANATYVQAQVNYDAALNGSLTNELSSLENTVKDRQFSYDNAVRDYENSKILYDAGMVSKVDLDSLETAMEARKSELDSAEKSLELYESSTMEGNLKTLEATLNQARASYESALESLNDASVKAEIGGVISAVDVSVGNTVTTASSTIKIVDMQRVKFSFGVTDKVINQIQIGTRAEITVSSLNDEVFEGYVSAISPAADSTSQLYPVEIYLDNPDQTIKPGMFAMIRIATDKHENVFSLPVDAVIEKDDRSYVFVLDEDLIAHQTDVETGLRNDQYIEITEGLSLGDIVVIIGQDFLEEGNLANIVSGPTPSGYTEETEISENSDVEE